MAKTEERDAVRQALDYFLNEWLEQIVVSGPRPSAAASRVRIRPAQVKGQTIFQAEEQRAPRPSTGTWTRRRQRLIWRS